MVRLLPLPTLGPSPAVLCPYWPSVFHAWKGLLGVRLILGHSGAQRSEWGGRSLRPHSPMVLWPAAHGLSTEDLQALGGVRVVSGQEVFGEVINCDLLWGGARPWGVLGTVGQWGWGMGRGQGP